MKLRTLGLATVLLGSSTLLISSSPPRPQLPVFFTFLTGSQEVPAVDTNGFGLAIVLKRPFSDSLIYGLWTLGVDNVAASHIHLAEAGTNGPVVAFLFESAEPVSQNGLIARGEITADDLIGPLAGQPLSALVDAMRNGGAYVNVHTTAHPPGEVRGQLGSPGR